MSGLISGARTLSVADLGERAARAAAGLASLGNTMMILIKFS